MKNEKAKLITIKIEREDGQQEAGGIVRLRARVVAALEAEQT